MVAYAYDDRWPRMSRWGFQQASLIRLQPMVILGSVFGTLLFSFGPRAAFPLTSGQVHISWNYVPPVMIRIPVVPKVVGPYGSAPNTGIITFMISPAIASQLLRLPSPVNCVLLQSEASEVRTTYRREKAIIPFINPSQERPAVGTVTTIEGVECLVAAIREETYNIIVEAWIEASPVPAPEAFTEARSMPMPALDSWMEAGAAAAVLEPQTRASGC